MGWDRIHILVDKIKDGLDKDGYVLFLCFSTFFCQLLHSYFRINEDGSNAQKIQTGVVRTNCMDNLDRTNVVQATIAKWILDQQLRELGILSAEDSIDNYEAISKDFRESKYDGSF
jgi:hypothetical protein